ncbi:MAG: hypothetical protein AAFP19_24395 [Bacteroidota bacterium]
MNLQEEIAKFIEEHQSLQLAKSHLAELNRRIEENTWILKQLEDILEKEYQDVQQFEKMSIRGIFHKVLGNAQQQLEIEKQEYLHAVLKHKEQVQMLKMLEFERQVLEEKMSKEAEINQRLNELLNSRQYQIKQNFPDIAPAIQQLNEEWDNKLGLKRELHEAIIAGVKAQGNLTKIIELLKKARDWGDWKHLDRKLPDSDANNRFIDQAQTIAYTVQQQLLVFEDELKDIYKYQKRPIIHHYEDFNHFTDIYYNRLVSDWIIRKKVQSALSNVEGTQDSVIRIVNALKHELKLTEEAMEHLEEKKKILLISADKSKS